MSLNEEVIASSDSFWEIDCFKRTVKRAEDGLHMCRELSRLIAERAEIEKDYAKKLQIWSKKWNETIEKGPEYGTNKAMLIGSLSEADAIADVHNSIKDKLTEVQADLKKWKNETYKKQVVGGCKESKAFEDEFRKAQKPWAKKFEKVIKCRKDYHSACKLEKSLAAQLSAEGNTEQAKKLQDRVQKSRKDVEDTKDKYEEALAVLHKYNPIYVSDMTEVFDKTQLFEEKRLLFFKDIMIGVHHSLDISKKSEIPNIYHQLYQTITLSDAQKDLKWWTQNHGSEMSMLWPTFEEYGAEPLATGSLTKRVDKTRSVYVASSSDNLQTASASEQNGVAASASASAPSQSAVVAAKQPAPVISQPTVQKEVAVSARSHAQPAPVPRQMSYDVSLNPFADDNSDQDEGSSAPSNSKPSSAVSITNSVASSEAVAKSETVTVSRPPRTVGSPAKTSEATASGNPFDEDDDDVEEDFSNVKGVAVEALFNYEAQENDELSFKQGDKFEKLKDRDDQGWCTGRKDGCVGLYPDNYVKVLSD